MDEVHSPPNDGRMNGQTHEPLSGLTTLISFNTKGFSREKADILSSLCRVNNCAVLLLQETHRGPTRNQSKIPGMNLIVERPHDQYGSAIYVKPGLDVNNTKFPSSRISPPGHKLQWNKWRCLNRLRSGVGKTKSLLLKWGYLPPGTDTTCQYGKENQTMNHLLT